MLGWKWVKGEAHLKALGELPRQPLMIPQPGGEMVAINLHPVDKPEKKLGALGSFVNLEMQHDGKEC